MDCIIERGDPFDCEENTSQEDRRVRAKFSTTTLKKEKVEKRERVEEEVRKMGDPFTSYVQEILAKTVFRNSIPSQPPDKEKDAPDLLRDKMTYHAAVQGAQHFKDEILKPLLLKIDSIVVDKLDNNLYYALREECRMTVTKINQKDVVSDWSGTEGAVCMLSIGTSYSLNVLQTEAEFLKALHNMYHLEKYIIAIIIDSVKNSGDAIQNYTQAWEFLATPAYAEKPIQDWEELTFILFVDYMLQLWMTIRFFQTF
jgi:hypothetical protein